MMMVMDISNIFFSCLQWVFLGTYEYIHLLEWQYVHPCHVHNLWKAAQIIFNIRFLEMPHCNDSDVDIVDIPEWRALLDWEESGFGMFTTHCWKTELLSLPLLAQTPLACNGACHINHKMWSSAEDLKIIFIPSRRRSTVDITSPWKYIKLGEKCKRLVRSWERREHKQMGALYFLRELCPCQGWRKKFPTNQVAKPMLNSSVVEIFPIVSIPLCDDSFQEKEPWTKWKPKKDLCVVWKKIRVLTNST